MIETTVDPRAELERLGREKRILSQRKDQTLEDWLKLLHQFEAIDARSNVAYCIYQAKRFGYVEPVAADEEVPEPEYEFDWQKYTGD